jgi:hypothetical protein
MLMANGVALISGPGDASVEVVSLNTVTLYIGRYIEAGCNDDSRHSCSTRLHSWLAGRLQATKLALQQLAARTKKAPKQ